MWKFPNDRFSAGQKDTGNIFLTDVGVSKSSADKETKLLKQCPYKISAVQLFAVDWKGRSWYCR